MTPMHNRFGGGNKKLISKWDRRTLPPEPRHCCTSSLSSSCLRNDIIASRFQANHLRPVYSDTTQLKSTSSWVELSCVGEVSIAKPTQLNSTSRWLAVRCNWVSCIADRRRQLSCVGDGVYSHATLQRHNSTELNSTSSSAELSCVAVNGP